jgi:hypothetical protein
MSALTNTHHELELELFRLRLLRDLRSPEYRAEVEDAVLDRMEVLWYAMSELEREVLEAERRARFGEATVGSTRTSRLPAVDVAAHAERALPSRISVDAA